MASIHDLSNETLGNILDFIDIDDLEAFALTCRAFYNNAKSRLQSHLEFKSAYGLTMMVGTLQCPDRNRFDDRRQMHLTSLHEKSRLQHRLRWAYRDVDLWHLLNKFELDSEMWHYPRTVCLGTVDTYKYIIPPARYELGELRSGTVSSLLHHLERFERMLAPRSQIGSVSPWRKEMGIDPSMVLLLSLPRLQKLRLHGAWFAPRAHKLWSILSLDVGCLANPMFEERAFYNLRELELSQTSGRCGMGADVVLCLVHYLPSLQKLKGYEVSAGRPYGSWIPFGLHKMINPGRPPLESIELRTSRVGASVWREYLRAAKALKSFSYNHADLTSESDQPHVDWEPRQTVRYLKRYTRHSLVRLELTVDWTRFHHTFASDEPFIGDIRRFQVLKEVCLERILLFKKGEAPSASSGAGEMEASASNEAETLKGNGINEQEADPESKATNPLDFIKMQRLQDIMPTSIETISLVGFLSKSEIGDLLEGLPEKKNHRLPNLHKINFKDGANVDSDTVAACNEVGVCIYFERMNRASGTGANQIDKLRNGSRKDVRSWSRSSTENYIDLLDA